MVHAPSRASFVVLKLILSLSPAALCSGLMLCIVALLHCIAVLITAISMNCPGTVLYFSSCSNHMELCAAGTVLYLPSCWFSAFGNGSHGQQV